MFRSPTWVRAHDGGEQPPLRAVLLNAAGTDNPGLHEAIGLECTASALLRAEPGTDLLVGDLQFDVMEGDLDLTRITEEIVRFVRPSRCPVIVGVGIPIYGWEHARQIITGVHERMRSTGVAIHWVIGNAIPTYVSDTPIRRGLPVRFTTIQGHSEKAIAAVVAAVLAGRPPGERLSDPMAEGDHYVPPLRLFTAAVHQRGGAPKIETSRGCAWGHCTFCSRHGRRGGDYFPVAAEAFVAQIDEVVAEIGPCTFDLTDEDAFADPEHTGALLDALEAGGRKTRLMASMRTRTVLERAGDGLLPRLVDNGLVKVFLGVEGGSDPYLKILAKGQSVAEIETAIGMLEALGVDYEIGFITFAWRMQFAMLVENVEFLRRHYEHVSYVFNKLHVRAGTVDERMLARQLGDPEMALDVQTASYPDVPFLDPLVGRAYAECLKFADDIRCQYAIKNVVRTRGLDEARHRMLQDTFGRLHALHMAALADIVTNEGREIAALEDARTRLFRDMIREFAPTAATNGQVRVMVRELADYVGTPG